MSAANGVRNYVTHDELKQHTSADNIWVALDGKVYNITSFLKYHPGGSDILLKKAAGRDATSLFYKYHPNVKAHTMLQKCFVGNLDPTEAPASDTNSSKTVSSVAKTAKSLLAKFQL